MKNKITFAGCVFMAMLADTFAGPTANLPYDGVAQGYAVVEPVTIHATNNLAGLQCDVLFDSNRLVCSNPPVLISGPTGIVVDGAQMAPGKFRLLAYMPSGVAWATDVVCNLTFSSLANAASGQVPLSAGAVHFGDDNAAAITTGKVASGQILVGTAFGFQPGGGRAQFLGATGSNYLINASTNLTSWTTIATNEATNSLVWTIDPTASELARRFYRSVQTSQ